MGGMKDEANRITIPPLFPRVHVNDTGRGGLSQPFDGKSMSLSKRSTLPCPTNKISDSPSTLSLSLAPQANNTRLHGRPEKSQFSPVYNTSPASKFEGKVNHPSARGSPVTNTKPSSIKQNEYHFKNLTNLDSLKDPVVRHSETNPQANTDLSLQFCNSSSNIVKGGEAAGSKASLNTLHTRELLLQDESKRGSSLSMMKSQLYRRRALDVFNVETQKKLKTVPPREQDVSDSSAIDSLSGVSASSNDIARVIGNKRFWKMRAYMINQQKIFAAQVFELHRLIMVQKMVARSPNLVLESKLHGLRRGGTIVASKVKKPNTENQKPVTEEYPEHMKPKLPLPSITKELMNPIWQQQLLPPPGNQWLVPVMSPSEGLVYKPYAGPCPPPPSAFMVPIYGQDSLLDTSAFRFPVSTQFSHNYFPQPNARTTVLDQTNPFGQLQRWSTTSSHMTQAIPFSLKKSQESNDSDVHGSTASSPPEKSKFDVLPLFPTEPTHHNEQKQQPLQHRAIKAIPHTSTSASESAARIFRSIQEERRDSDHMIS
ncbi:hydroxyproline-rich glycoprotein family protein [Raphanus sativus]|uniref:Protein HEADING DATE 3B n=1 Tax=Raphanus sativus TaxID=3726 RepID=A0A6J0P312_RAPSA|nr:protein HEADING DATE 3B [Raphanus sativus]KAJ4894210.1 hydroxyproline-rich glycoprotein family protein [Raphanus sativus]